VPSARLRHAQRCGQVIGYLLSVIGYLLSVIGYLLSVIGYRLFVDEQFRGGFPYSMVLLTNIL
jgi:hypothetical protein